MSRVGRKVIKLPKGVSVSLDGRRVAVKGPLGSIAMLLPVGVGLAVDGDLVQVQAPPRSRTNRGFQGLVRARLWRMVEGVEKGFSRALEIQGVGYRAELQGRVLKLAVGHSHSDMVDIPEGLEVQVDKTQTKMQVRGIDLQAVGQLAAEIRGIRPPEPYKGKGIKLADEVVRRKAGKAGSK